MDTRRPVLDRLTRDRVLRHYARAHDQLAEAEQVARGVGAPDLGDHMRRHAQAVLRAWLAERDDPKPEGLP